MIIQFAPTEMLQILHFASVIHETKRVNNVSGEVNNRRYAKDIDDFSMNLIGCMGEAAFCKAVGMSYHVDFSKFGDSGNDVDFGGFDVQIKTSSRYHGDDGLLYVNDINAIPSHIIVSACIDGPASVRLLGAISKDKFRQIMFKHDLGYGMRDCVYNHQLSTIEQMIEWVNSQGI